MSKFVRIIGMELKNFKNVVFGGIQFPNHQSVKILGEVQKSDITGIYGQNGSGKTAAVEALDIVKSLMSGRKIDFRAYSGIVKNNTSITLNLFVQNDDAKYLVKYTVHLALRENVISIPKERLEIFDRGVNWKNKRAIEVDNPFYNESIVLQDVHAKVNCEGKINEYEFINSPDKLAVSCASRGESFFFNESLLKSFEGKSDDGIINSLRMISIFSKRDFFVIKVRQLGLINGSGVLPLNVSDTIDNHIISGCIPLFVNGNGSLPEVLFDKLPHLIDSINTALSAIIPNLRLTYKKTGEDIYPNGMKSVNVDLFSQRGDSVFSTKYESEGIKRILSLLSCLISAYNNENVSLVVDEFDSGIFEYMLGEILSAMEKGAKGQLIFTSHNLRAFEKLSNESIVCSTAEPDNRYIRLTRINRNNNKRDFYIRALALGGQKESLYDGDCLEDIGYALRKAGVEYDAGQ